VFNQHTLKFKARVQNKRTGLRISKEYTYNVFGTSPALLTLNLGQLAVNAILRWRRRVACVQVACHCGQIEGGG